MATYNNIQPWRDQFLINEEQSAALGSWTTTAALLPSGVYSHTAIVAKGFVFVFQGLNSAGTRLDTIYRASIGSDGVLGTFSFIGTVPNTVTSPARCEAQAILINDVIYIIGGRTGSTTATSSVIACPVNSDGSLGTWFNSNSLPGVRRSHIVCGTNNIVYSIGGNSGYAVEGAIYTAAIDPDTGLLGTWSTSSVSLPMERSNGAACIIDGFLYYFGGYDYQSVKKTTIYKGIIAGDGTISSISTYGVSLPIALIDFQLVVTHGALYIIGGALVNTVYRSVIGTDGSLGELTGSSDLPVSRFYSAAVITSSKLYLIGGYSSNTLATAVGTAFSGGSNDYTEVPEEPTGVLVLPEELDEIVVAAYTWNVGKVVVEEQLDDVVGQFVSGIVVLEINDSLDDVNISGWTAVAAKLNAEESIDSLLISGYSPNIGQINVNEEIDVSDISAIDGTLIIEGIISTIEYVDKISIIGVNQANKIIITEDVDDLIATGITWNVGIVKVREYLDVITGSLIEGESKGTVIISEEIDSISSIATTSNVGKISITSSLDDVNIIAATEQLNIGVININEVIDTISSQAIICIGAVVNINESVDDLNGIYVSGIYGNINIQEELDVIKATIKIIIPALNFSRQVTTLSDGSLATNIKVLHFDRDSIDDISTASPIVVDPIHFTR